MCVHECVCFSTLCPNKLHYNSDTDLRVESVNFESDLRVVSLCMQCHYVPNPAQIWNKYLLI